MIDEEQLIILKRFCNPTPKNRLNDIANDYGITTKELKGRIRKILKQLLLWYELEILPKVMIRKNNTVLNTYLDNLNNDSPDAHLDSLTGFRHVRG